MSPWADGGIFKVICLREKWIDYRVYASDSIIDINKLLPIYFSMSSPFVAQI
jgi:hypothetical protein